MIRKTMRILSLIQYEFAIFIILFTRLFTFLVEKLDGDLYLLPSYLVDYSYGFGGRKLIGSIFRFCFPDTLPMSAIIVVTYVVCVVLIISLSGLLGTFIRRMKEYGDTYYIFGICLCTMYLVSPFSVAFLFTPENFARFDIYLYLLALIFIILFFCRRTVSYYIALFAIGVVGSLIHHAFISTYFILVLALSIYDWYQTDFSVKRFGAYAIVGFLLLVVVAAIVLFSSNNVSYEEMYIQLQGRTDGVLNQSGIQVVYYEGLIANMKAFVMGNLTNELLGLFLISIFLSPLYYMFYYIWRVAVNEVADKKYKITINAMNSCFFLLIPLCVVAIDYARWLAAALFCQMALIAVLAYKRDKGVLKGIDGVANFLKKNVFISVSYVVFLGSLSYFGSMLFTPLFSNLMRILELYIGA